MLKKRSWTGSFIAHLVSGLLLIHVFLIPLLFNGVYKLLTNGLHEQFVAHVRTDGRHLSNQLAYFFQSEQDRPTADFLDNLIFDGNVIFAAFAGQDGSLTNSQYNPPALSYQEDLAFAAGNDMVYFIAVPVQDTNGHIKGYLQLGYDESLTKELLMTAKVHATILILGYVLLSLMLVFLMGYNLARLLTRIRIIARNIISKSDTGEFAIQTHIREIDGLAADLETMRQTLLSREHHVQMIIDQSLDAYVGMDSKGKVTHWNHKAATLFGWTPGEAIGSDLAELIIPPKQRNAHKRGLRKYLEGGAGPILNQRIEVNATDREGRQFPVELAITPLHLDFELSFSAFIQDISKRRQQEDEQHLFQEHLYHTQKLESLGLMAGSIAHDFNNLLMSITGNIDLALDELPQASPSRNYLQDVQHGARYAAELCKQMLAYSGRGKFIIEKVDLNQFVAELAHILTLSLGRNVTFKRILCDHLPLIEADKGQLQQVVMNLITNASEAISKQQGLVTISTGVIDCDKTLLERSQYYDEITEGRYVYFEVADSGCGMDEETVEKIFDPFFTTKSTGRGLGMSAILGIVRSHKGYITLDSTPGKGTTIRILFPALDKNSADEAIPPSEETTDKPSFDGTGTVLLADDDENVRQVCQHMLENLGFEVITASDADETLKLFSQHNQNLICTVLDLSMQMQDADACYNVLRDLNSEHDIIIISGYSDNTIEDLIAADEHLSFLQKPFTMNELQTAMQTMLARLQSE